MAKIQGPWLRGAKKKLAGVVLQKGSQGGTIAREWVIPKNPQTSGQMSQRIIFATVTQALALMQGLVNHSFEGVEYGAKSKRMFSSLNIKKLRALAAEDFANNPLAVEASVFTTTQGVSQLVPNKYIVAQGSLPPVETLPITYNDSDGVLVTTTGVVVLPAVSGPESGNKSVTLGSLLNALFGVTQPGEMITLAMIVSTTDLYAYSYNNDTAPGFQIPYTEFDALRLVFRQDLNLEEKVLISNNGTEANEHALENIASAINEALDWTKSTQLLRKAIVDGIPDTAGSISIANNQITIDELLAFNFENLLAPPVGFKPHVYAATWIRSLEVDGKWKRSNAEMTLCPINENHNNGLIWAVTNDAWFTRMRISESDRFLNEGGSKSNVIQRR